MEEIWKDIPGYEKYYMASTLGRIKSKDRVIKTVLKGKEIKYIKRGRIMTPCLNSGKYLGLPINTDKLKKNENVHRLIAITFLPNPNNLPCVNHKDENKLNNCVDNLEWCTYQHNNVWKNRLAKSLETFNANPKNRRKVYQYTKDGAFIKEYESVKEATKEMGLKHSSGIYLSCNHNNCYARGFKWSFNSPSL